MNAVFDHGFVHWLVGIIVKFVANMNAARFFDLFILGEFYNVAIVRNNRYFFR